MKLPLAFLCSLVLFSNAYAQSRIYFYNQTGRPVWIQKRSLLEVNSYPYVLDSNSQTLQSIPVDSGDPSILNVVVVADKGPYGSPDGVYYLFKNADTLLIGMTAEEKPLFTHISSETRTRELAFPLGLMKQLNITPFYTLERTNPQLYKQIYLNTLSPRKRDRLIDSLVRPFADAALPYCAVNQLDPEIGELYRHQFEGMLIHSKLNAYGNDYKQAPGLYKYYKDSIDRWLKQSPCETCSNIPHYNLAMRSLYGLRFGDLTEVQFMDTVSVMTRGYLKDFILSRYMIDRAIGSSRIEGLLNKYNLVSSDSMYKQIVFDYYILHNNVFQAGKGEHLLMNTNKEPVDFDKLVASFQGKIIYVDFWASWCKPCIEEMPYSHRLAEKLDEKGVVFLYISLDEDFGNWKKASERYGVEGYILSHSAKEELAKKLKLHTIPRYLIIDKGGKIIDYNATRPSDLETRSVLLKLAKD